MKKLIYIITAALTLGTLDSCKKFVDINTNPNAPTSVDAASLLPPIEAGMERGVWYDSRYIGQYSQMWGASTANNVWDQEGYVPGSDSAGEMWRTVYFSLGQNVTLMMQDAMANNKYEYLGVAHALRAWGWQTGGDLYNYMIVKEAFDPTKLTFNYDSPDYVYAEVIRECRQALSFFAQATKADGNAGVSATLAKGDYMYYGDRSKWVKFIYSIMATNALHLSNKATFSADSVAKYVDLSFASNADNASVQNTGSNSGDANFWGPTRGNLAGFRQSDFIVRLLDGRILAGKAAQDTLADPRLPLLLNRSKDRTYRGVIPPLGDPNSSDANTLIPQFAGATTANSGTSAAKYLFNDNSRGVLMTYPVLQFMKSEALFKKGDLAGAYTAYINGVKGALEFASNPPIGGALTGSTNYISATAQAAYLAGPSVRQSAATLKLSDILQQKFISLFLWNPLEQWADERRYQYDANIFQGFVKPGTLYADNAGKQVYVVRPRYNSEYIWNIPALQSFGATAPDYHTTKPWFILP
ncbi:SusD/RagB family nutrient-binding outer membrane lipoprotein [Mucilaginibacter ginkgonis]|uniref:SusD/RagB family nutrient-binding outer membrane lipoprotein n=1 Tax=Mucilaginibacter ginkgonis TaxID=2682091 RepID=A0A6I4I7B1_9SPHI|nr:SusD/RagB family nutrient-binding outer membrane lipoprotein [Mucilaginibacter ginkgonis]QQL49228.1 SusD/RagB family nutrient-binding outer membrane lipoprotein [Mucilaginibacter ginkgonis]